MKTKLIGFLFAFAVLAGCGKASGPDRWGELAGIVAQAPFAATARVLWEDAEYEAECSRDAQGGLLLSLRSAGLSAPVEYQVSGGALTIRQGEHALTVREDNAPAGCAAIALRDALAALSLAEPKEEDGKIFLENEGQSHLMKLDAENYGFCRVELRGGSFEFQSFAYS